MRPDWSGAGNQEDIFLAQMRTYFQQRTGPERQRILGDLLNLCTSQQLAFVSNFVSPLLKKDPMTTLPDELCLRVSLLTITCSCMLCCCLTAYANRGPRYSHLSTTERCWQEHLKYRGVGETCFPTT